MNGVRLAFGLVFLVATACGSESSDSGGTAGSGGTNAGGGSGGSSGAAGASGATGGIGGAAGTGGATGGIGGAAGSAGSGGAAGAGGTASEVWLAYLVDVATNNPHELYAYDVSDSTPTPTRLNPPLTWPQQVTSFAWSPTLPRVAYVEDQSTANVAELFVVDMSSASPGAPQNASGGNVGSGGFQWSPADGRIAFASNRDSADIFELFVVDVSQAAPGTAVKASGTMTYGSAVESLRWSPDGKWIAYRVRQSNGHDELYAVDVSGAAPKSPVKVSGAMTATCTNCGVDDYSWSPDSKWIAYRSDQETWKVLNTYLVDMASGTPAAPQKYPSGNMLGEFSPDGTRLAYMKPAAPLYELQMISLSQSGPSAPVTLASETVPPAISSFAWAPNGKSIQFGTTDGVYWIDLSGTTPGAPVKLSSSFGGLTWAAPTWSPDSKWIAYRDDSQSAGTAELYVIDPTAKPLAPIKVSGALTSGGDVGCTDFTTCSFEQHAWKFAPNSQSLVYLADQDTDESWELYYVDLSTGTPTSPVKLNPSITNGGNIWDFFWLSDSSRIAFRGDAETATVNELYFVDFSGPSPSAPVKASPAISGPTGVQSFGWQP